MTNEGEEQKDRQNYILRNLMISTLHLLLRR